MSFYFREKPRFGDKPRGKPRDELLQELKQQFDDSSKSFFEPATTRLSRDPFERHTAFSRGFPFDDVDGGFGRRSSDIRSHLDDLASRHPEFADHLLGPAWGDIPAFHTGSLSRRRRGSGSSSSHQGHPDDDARSQASGSSGTSAASGASGVSSQGEPRHRPSTTTTSTNFPGKNYQQDETTTRRNPIPQYGLRNTVDIGQHRHNMENPEKIGARGQRSMSAPPENRQQDENPSAQESSQNPNQRFVSRVDITPQFVQPPQQPQQQQPQPQPEKTTKPAQQGNVRHIPIFVEGRDEPVIPKNVDQVDHEPSAWTYKNSGAPQAPFHQPPQFSSPPQFHRPSHFNQHYGRARDWLPDFEEEFYGPQSTFQQPRRTQPQQHHHQFPSQSPPKPSSFRQQPQAESRRQQEHPFYSQQPHNQHQQPQQPQQQQQQPQEPQEPRKQTQPKDPLEKVAEVQKEVDALTEQVNQWSGTSRKDKQYMYLDEMLTRELIKLDDIETEGKENVRQARKNAIKSIQNSISLLESKAPLPEQLQEQQQQQQQQPMETVTSEAANENPEAAEQKEEQAESESGNEPQAIPLPAAPASPTKDQQQQPETATENSSAEQTQQLPETQSQVEEQQRSAEAASEQQSNEQQQVAMEAGVEKVASAGSMEVQAAPETQEAAATTENATKMETENPGKSPKVAKKVKKTKKQPPQQQQTPVCDDAIPLPAPETQQGETK